MFYIDSRKEKVIDDKTYISRQYKRKMGKNLNLDNPILYNEKIQWLKLHYRNSQIKKCVDKYEIRKFVESRVCEKVLIPLYGVYNSVDEIDFVIKYIKEE